MPTEQTKKDMWTYGMLSFLIISMSILAGFIGYGKGGFNEELILKQFFIYGWVGVGGAVVILIHYNLEKTIKEGDSKYGDGGFFNNPGETPSITSKILKDKVRLLLVSLIFFSIVGIFATLGGQTYLGVGTLGQQFTEIDGILYNILLVVPSENLGSAGLVFFSIFLFRILARKYNLEKKSFILLSIFLCVFLFMMVGFINHQLRYSGSEESLIKVIGFWGIGGLITGLSGSFIPFYVMHNVNNVFVKLSELFSNELIIGYAIVVILFLGALLYFYERRK